MQQPIVPFWFKQRQCKAEPVGDNVLKLTGPNLGESFIAIRKGENGRWQAAFRSAADGPDLAVAEPEQDTPEDAWEAAFELYRVNVVS
jgi:hypothetical protein